MDQDIISQNATGFLCRPEGSACSSVFYLKLEEDQLDVVRFCVEHVLEKWSENYEKEIRDKRNIKNPITMETLMYKRDWIENMRNILSQIEEKQTEIDKYYEQRTTGQDLG